MGDGAVVLGVGVGSGQQVGPSGVSVDGPGRAGSGGADPAGHFAGPAREELVERALELADQVVAAVHVGALERRQRERLARLVDSPGGLDFTLALTDQVARIPGGRRSFARLRALVAEQGMPAFLGPVDGVALRAGLVVGEVLPRAVAGLVRARVRSESSAIVLRAGDRRIARHSALRREQGIDLNYNILGEAILGQDAADQRRDQIVHLCRLGFVDYVSVKASAVCPRISTYAFADSLARVTAALRPILVAAAARRPPVFVNLDMEEYRDLELTLAAFKALFEEPALAGMDAGIVLQGYLPESHAALDELAAWAKRRHTYTGATTRVRLVKGANLGMELVEAELHGWTPAPYTTKLDVDVSYKRLLERALDPSWGPGLRVGLASHNLFDVAWGLLLASELGTADRLEVEMLEGMGPGEPEALRRMGFPVRLYAPVVPDEQRESAAAYLVRRLDENSGIDNYLRHSLEYDLAGPRDTFRAAIGRSVSFESRRAPLPSGGGRLVARSGFSNAADTDWALAENRTRMGEALASPPKVDPLPKAGTGLVDRAIERAGESHWWNVPAEERARILERAADVLEERRFDLIAVMAHEAGKVIGEGDVEVSEAVDLARYYAAQAAGLPLHEATASPLGTVAVVPPWNFPLAIPMGGVLAALAAGNSVILKPSRSSPRTAALGAACLWGAGVPSDALQVFVAGEEAGRRLVTDPGVDAVVLTGSFGTARSFLEWRPGLHLLAETSGKNAIVVTQAADLDQAVADVVQSAFGHAGQKCSAASLVIVEKELVRDGRFLRRLADAVRTLRVGPAEDPASEVGPLIRPARGNLLRALKKLDRGESWLVRPHKHGPALWSPGGRMGVVGGSWFHQTECFGPVLGVMVADGLDEAIALQNGTAFGLTGGLESLDPEEIRHWLERVEVGNAYVNRPITGAVVRRQPFGGWKRSSVGPTAKAGGPHYVAALCQWTDATSDRLAAAEVSYPAAWASLSVPTDPSALRAERNLLRHLPLPAVVLYVGDDADPVDVALCRLAAATVGTPIAEDGIDGVGVAVSGATKLRVLGTPPFELLENAHQFGWVVDSRRPVADGEVELPRWVREQSVSITAHRYGRLISTPL